MEVIEAIGKKGCERDLVGARGRVGRAASASRASRRAIRAPCTCFLFVAKQSRFRGLAFDFMGLWMGWRVAGAGAVGQNCAFFRVG
jgi:hypothetical protein